MNGQGGDAGRARQRALIAALVCGAFGIGVSEFLVMGLLPEIAQDLSPVLYAAHPEAAIAAAGGMASGYALGVVVGMIVTPIVLRRLSERSIVAICAAAMLVLTLLTVLSPNLPVAVVLRFLSALAHASYVGLASLMAARALGSRHHGRGAAIVVGGLTMANVVGVPLLTAFGAVTGWRIALGVCALLFAAPLLALARIAPLAAETAAKHPERSRAGGPWRLVVAIVLVTSLASGAFAITTFVAPISLHAQGPSPVISVAVLMLVFGIGMNLGNFGGGAVADRSAPLTLLLGAAAGAGGALLLLPGGMSGGFAGAGVFLVGVGLGALTPSAQVIYVRLAQRRPRLAASLAPGTINLGSFVGALLGGIGLAGVGAQAVVWVALALFGLGLALQLFRSVTGDRLAAPTSSV
ncbi:MFS transporter [Leucobacter weissii]|uniref:MFS transporter n=2 Tax=Leucobacter weissii TaxID=1983706 RepID=A0A939MR66_9MICO|nr:MFS transporter [Leucobacter weissii]